MSASLRNSNMTPKRNSNVNIWSRNNAGCLQIQYDTNVISIKGMAMFDLHVHWKLKLHLLNNIFQISNFKFSLEKIARWDPYHSSSQCYVLEV